MTALLPISAILPTRDRCEPLTKMLMSLAQQGVQPIELIVVDASTTAATAQLCQQGVPNVATQIIYHAAIVPGAAVQRNQAITHASQPVIWFLEDDIILEPDCLERLWAGLQSDRHLGGVNAMITNQQYQSPGRISRLLFQFLHGQAEMSYAGKCIGPALNLLPEDRLTLPEVVPVEWLNTGCTLYRREALPEPPFPDHFTGYSFMEDVTLSLTVGRTWKLANIRTARMFHDSQPGDYKRNGRALAKMQLVNRHYVMTQILGREQFMDHCKLAVLELFGILASLQSRQGWILLPGIFWGKGEAIVQIAGGKQHTSTVVKS